MIMSSYLDSFILLWIAILLASFIYGAIRAVYLLFFHPLAKVPGPTLYSISLLPQLYHTVRGEWPYVVKELHDKYGPVMRIAPNDVSFITPGAWKKIYGHKHAGEPHFDKDITFYRMQDNGYLLTADDANHGQIRRLLAHAFSEKAMRGQEPVLLKYSNIFAEKLGERAEKHETVDIVRWFNYATFDLFGELAFGEPFDCMKKGGYHPWVDIIFKGIKLSVYTHSLKRLGLMKTLGPYIMPKSLVEGFRDHQQLSANTVKKRIETGGPDREDLMSYILRHKDTEREMSLHDLTENADLLIVAGSETTATALSGTIYQLLTHPVIYGKLVDEIRTHYQSNDDISVLSANSLEYTGAVLNEGLRMYPPVPVGLPRCTPKGGAVVEGYFMPEDTFVSIPQWAANYSDRNFRHAHEFIPERWLGDKSFADDTRDVWQPFSFGPRNCIGKNLANIEMRILLIRLLLNFDLELLPDSYDWKSKQRIYKLWEKSAINVRIIPVSRGKK